MVSQVVAILLLILGHDHLQQFFVLGQIALWVAVITAVGSGIDYYRRFNHVLGSRKRVQPGPKDSRTFNGRAEPIEPSRLSSPMLPPSSSLDRASAPPPGTRSSRTP